MSGFWQIKLHAESREKTAFITPQGLFEFQVMPFGLTNAPAVFQRLMQQVLMGLNPPEGPDFVSVYIDDILIYLETLEDHLEHLKCVIERLMTSGLKLNPTKCHFVRQEVEYLGHIITPTGLKPNPKTVSSVKEFTVPQDVKGVQRFLGLDSYYRRFIPKLAKIAHPLHQLTRKGVPFEWTEDCQMAFETLKVRLISAPVLVYPDFSQDFLLETDASIMGLGAVLSQVQGDQKPHPISYASRSLSMPEKNYGITELETLAVVWAVNHYHAYLYGHKVTVLTDHSAVKAVLDTPSPSGKHARWWTKVYGSGVGEVKIVYRSGRENANADALSRQPHLPAPGEGNAQDEVQIAVVSTGAPESGIHELLDVDIDVGEGTDGFAEEQRKDPDIAAMIDYLANGKLPQEDVKAHRVMAQELQFELIDGVLLYLDRKYSGQKCAVVPEQLREQILKEYHSGPMSGHFSGPRLYSTLVRRWWWRGMYTDTISYCKKCPQCIIVGGTGRINRPPLHPIPVQRAFQIMGIDIMDLPKTEMGNCHVVVFQDFLTKWPMVFPVPDRRALRLAKLLAEEIVPVFGVPEALLSDRGANLLSHLMMDLCQMLGVRKLNTTSYHPQCDGMVEHFNRTLKTMFRKHVDQFGKQWDQYLSGLLWAYRNTPHESTGEKPSFLLFGFDCRSPTETALLPPDGIDPMNVSDYRQELMLSLSSARETAAKCIRQAQKKYKSQHDKKLVIVNYELGDWVFVKFPHEETGRIRKLSRPWHGPYRIISIDDPDVSVVNVYFSQDPSIQVHLSRVQSCPIDFPAGYYWYGSKRRGPGRPPKWVDSLLSGSIPLYQDGTEPESIPDRDCLELPQENDVQPNPEPAEKTVHPCRYPLRSRSGRAVDTWGVM